MGLIDKLEEEDVSDVTDFHASQIDHVMKPRTGVESCKDAEKLLQNVAHPVKDNAILVKKKG